MTAQQQISNWIGRVIFWLAIAVILFYVLFPFYWVISSSFKTEGEFFSRVTLIPDDPTLLNYTSVFGNQQFLRGLLNSVVVSSVSVTLALVVGSFAAYALGRMIFPGRRVLLYLILTMTMFPQISILAGLFQVINQIGAFGSLMSLILSYPLLTLPFTVWVLTSFFQGLPPELEQAALVDGASPFQVFYMILLPLTAPALVTAGLLAFVATWNEYLYALTFTTVAPATRTVTVAIALFSGRSEFQEPIMEIMAASVIVTVPLLVLVLVFQQRITAGLTAGALKG